MLPLVVLLGCKSEPDGLVKPVIGHGGEYSKVLAKAEELSKVPLQKIANDEELAPSDKQALTEASVQFQALVDFEPGQFAPYLALGMIYRALGNLESAERNLRQCLNNIPASDDPSIVATKAEAHYQLSKVLFDNADYQGAGREAELALQLDQENPNYFVGRASALAQLEKKKEALKDLDSALKLDPNHKRARGLKKLLTQ